MDVDFVKIMTLTRNGNGQVNNLIQKHQMIEDSVSTSKQREKKRHVISMIKDLKLFSWREFITISLLCVSGGILLMTILLVAKYETTNFLSVVELHQNSLNVTDAFSYALLLSEYVVTFPKLL